MDNFDLLVKPWIWALMSDGSNKCLSLKETLLQATDIAEVFGEHPAVTLSLNRLLIGIATSALRGAAYDTDLIGKYLEKYKNSFNLFDRKRPFLQDASLASGQPSVSSWPPTAIAFTKVAGHNRTIFDHSLDETASLSVEECTRWLLTTKLLSVRANPGKGYNWVPTLAPLSGGACFLLTGKNLSETIILNRPNLCLGKLPWERSQDRPGEKRKLEGPLDSLVGSTRSVRLCQPEEDGLVHRVLVTSGVVFESFEDHMWLRVTTKTKDVIPFSFPYSDSELPVPAITRLPEIISQFPRCVDAKEIQVFGFVRDKSTMSFFIQERIRTDSLYEKIKAIEKAKPVIQAVCRTLFKIDISAFNLSRRMTGFFWTEILRHLSVGDFAEPRWSEVLIPEMVKKVTGSYQSFFNYWTPKNIEDAIKSGLNPESETVAEKKAKTKPAKTQKKQVKGPRTAKAKALSVICGDHTSRETRESILKYKRKPLTVGQKELAESLATRVRSRHGERPEDDVKFRKKLVGCNRAEHSLFKIVCAQRPQNGKGSIPQLLANHVNGEKLLKNIVHSRKDVDAALDAVKRAVSELPCKEFSFRKLLEDMKDIESSPDAACYRLVFEFIQAGGAIQ